MNLSTVLLISALLQSCIEAALVRNDNFDRDVFNKGGHNVLDDTLIQSDHVLRSDDYARGARFQGYTHNANLDRDNVIGQGTDSLAAEYDRGTFNFSMGREVAQKGDFRNFHRDAGVATEYQSQAAVFDDGLRSNAIALEDVKRLQNTDTAELDRQALFSHNTSQTVVDRGAHNAARSQNVEVSPYGGRGSLAADSAKTQDFANILDIDLLWDHERDVKAREITHNAQESSKAGKFDSEISPVDAQARSLTQAKDRSSQYAKRAQGLYERADIVDNSGTKDLRSRWEKSKIESDVDIENGAGFGRSAEAKSQGFDVAMIDGTVYHNATRRTLGESEDRDDRSSDRLAVSEQFIA